MAERSSREMMGGIPDDEDDERGEDSCNCFRGCGCDRRRCAL